MKHGGRLDVSKTNTFRQLNALFKVCKLKKELNKTLYYSVSRSIKLFQGSVLDTLEDLLLRKLPWKFLDSLFLCIVPTNFVKIFHLANPDHNIDKIIL